MTDPRPVQASWELDGTLLATAKVLRRVYDAALVARLGITLNEAAVLGQLAALGSQTQVELGRQVGLSRARVGVHIDALEGRGAVRRDPDPTDRRVWRVSLTRRGRTLCGRAGDVQRTVADGVHLGLAAADLARLSVLLQTVRVNGLATLGVPR